MGGSAMHFSHIALTQNYARLSYLLQQALVGEKKNFHETCSSKIPKPNIMLHSK